jgi:hypothetical protein
MYADAVAILRAARALDADGFARLSSPLPEGYVAVSEVWVKQAIGDVSALDDAALERLQDESQAVGAGAFAVIAAWAGAAGGATAADTVLASLDDPAAIAWEAIAEAIAPFAQDFDLLLAIKDSASPVGAAAARLGLIVTAAVVGKPVPFSETAGIASGLFG